MKKAALKPAPAARAKGVDFHAAKLPQAILDAAFASGGYPYDKKLKGKRYERELRALQIELVKLLNWAKAKGERIIVVFEGRDAAGKGGAIQRLTQHLNPRQARVVALTKPTPTEAGQWYFQRYAQHMPTRGEMTIFDRSWYNRAGVEPVFGFCKPEETDAFLREAPGFESAFTRDGAHFFKFFLTVGKEMQIKRLNDRWNDALNRWKISDIDAQAIEKWDAYSRAFERMLRETDHKHAPWTVIRANDKKRSRLEVIRHVLEAIDYEGKDKGAVGKVDRKIVLTAKEFLKDGGEEA
jgi:polyphosphate kinase 2